MVLVKFLGVRDGITGVYGTSDEEGHTTYWFWYYSCKDKAVVGKVVEDQVI